jgi:hypothetical protein
MTQATPTTSTATVATDRPGRYGKQLVGHLTRRATGEWDEEAGTGWIQFTGGRVVLTATDGALDLALSADDDVERLEDVVGRHLVRFGTRDELVVRWSRSDGSAGSVQENTAEE